MTIIEKCTKWNYEDRHKDIIELIENLPEEELTPEILSILGRAYNNYATQEEKPEYARKAVEVLSGLEPYFSDDHTWNFRLAYSYFLLNMEYKAIPYFEKALELLPGDEDTEHLLNLCKTSLTCPSFSVNFSDRVQRAWKSFEDNEAGLRAAIDRNDTDRILEIVNEALNIICDDIAMEIGHNGEKYELILSPAGDKARLFPIYYISRQMPDRLSDKWNLRIGNSGLGKMSVDGNDYRAEDIYVNVSPFEKDKVRLTAWSEKLSEVIDEDESKASWIVYTLTDHYLGEICAMSLVDYIGLSATKPDGELVSLDRLGQYLTDKGYKMNNDVESVLEGSSVYSLDPDKNKNEDFVRKDLVCGSTSLMQLVSETLDGESYSVDYLHSCGIIAGSLVFPLSHFEDSKELFALREEFEDVAMSPDARKHCHILGGATGTEYAYIDFLAYNMDDFIEFAVPFFKSRNIPSLGFAVFRKDASLITIYDNLSEDADEDFPDIDDDNSGENPFDENERRYFSSCMSGLVRDVCPDKEEIIRRLGTLEDLNITDVSEVDDVLEIEAKYENEMYLFSFDITTFDKDWFNGYFLQLNKQYFTKQEMEEFGSRDTLLRSYVKFGQDCMKSFHLQLKVMNAVLPDMLALIDASSMRLFNRIWVNLAAKSTVPPSPQDMYNVHAVNDKDKVWLHTHGLTRCHLTELEIVGSNTDAYRTHYDLLSSFANRLIDMQSNGDSEELTEYYQNPVINLGKFSDDRFIVATAIPWREAISEYPDKVLGGISDREDDHNFKTNIIFLYADEDSLEKGRYSKVSDFDKLMEVNPVFFYSRSETERMAHVARERFGYVERFMQNLQEDESAIVKIGIPVESDEDDELNAEHIWFGLISCDNGKIVAELLQEPYWIPDIKVGDIREFALDDVTDWVIYREEGKMAINPSNAYLLDV